MHFFFDGLFGKKKKEINVRLQLEAFRGFIDKNDDSEIYKSEVIQKG